VSRAGLALVPGGGRRALLCLLLSALLPCAAAAARAAEPRTAPGAGAYSDLVAVVHLHTTVSDGLASPAELAHAARQAGVDALVITDHFVERVAYAPWPIGNVMGVALSRPSILSRGIRHYLHTLAAAERETGTLVLPGLEVSPYARWTGSLLARTLALEGWHRHVLVVGIEDEEALSHLPVAGNRAGGRYGAWSILYLVPAAALAWSAARAARPACRETRLGKFRLRTRRLPIAEGFVAAASLVLLAFGFPFKVESFSPVAADPGDAPFRLLEDRVRFLGGATSWAHPEAAAGKEAMGVRFDTAPYPGLVRRTDADAFGALPEGVKSLLPAGGLWDQALRDHLDGRRRSAPFALAELDEHRAAGEVDLSILQTVFQVRERSHAGLLEAMKSGRMYGRWTPDRKPPLSLIEWSAGAPGAAAALAGGTLRARGTVTIRLAVGGGDGAPAVARLLRAGDVIWSRRAAPPFQATIEDDPPGTTCYRLDVEGAYPYRLIGNPIFVLRSTGQEEGA
jgi:hypothetical protein